MFGKKKLVTRPDKMDILFDSMDANVESIVYNTAAMRTPIDTVAYNHHVRKADEYEEQAQKLSEIAHRPRRRGLFG